MRPGTVKVHAALIAVSTIYGYFYVAVKQMLHNLSPGEFILLRFVLTALAVFLLRPRLTMSAFPKGADLWKVLGLGLVGVFMVQILVVMGLHQTTAFHSALIMATIPIMTLSLSILLGRETFHIQKLLGILIAFAGVSVLLFFTRSPGAPLPPTYIQGDLIVLLNAMAFSWFLLGSQRMLQVYSPFSFMSYCYIFSAALFVLLYAGVNLSSGTGIGLAFLARMSAGQWLLIAYVVVFASIGTYTLNNYALKQVSPSVVAVYMFIQPVISAATGFYILGEPFNLQMAGAALLTFIGVLMATLGTEKGVYLRKLPVRLPLEPEPEPPALVD